MRPDEIIEEIGRLANDDSLNFSQMSQRLADVVSRQDRAKLLKHLEYAGMIPERFSHDSTEEKLYAKYCDLLLARALNELGVNADVVEERGDAADVEGVVPGRYSIVSDAKGFRLSRTAKNQKDFKVEALNSWRKKAEYACLVCPIFQYPTKKSQIYSQAKKYNVALLSYTHLHLMVKSIGVTPPDMEPLWKIPQSLPQDKDAQTYWQAVDAKTRALTGATGAEWEKSKESTRSALRNMVESEVSYWQGQKAKVRTSSRAELELLVTKDIDNKIETIKGISKVDF